MATFRGIEIAPNSAKFCTSRVLASINEEFADKGTVYTHKLIDEVVAGNVSDDSPAFEEISNVIALLDMNYQVCNGGVMQYYDNGYNKDKDTVQEALTSDITELVSAIYGDTSEVSDNLLQLRRCWEAVDYIESEEDMCWECGGTGTYEYEDEEFELCTDVCAQCGGSGYTESDPYIVGGDDFENCLYEFDEFDNILEMYAEYVYKKHFETTL